MNTSWLSREETLSAIETFEGFIESATLALTRTKQVAEAWRSQMCKAEQELRKVEGIEYDIEQRLYELDDTLSGLRERLRALDFIKEGENT